MASTLSEYLSSQEDLVREAAEALPHQFSNCTHSLGYLRQAVYLCTTCPEPRGLCSACSIACHTDHEQAELFPKRNFRCDCPTASIARSCTLHSRLEDPNLNNEYGQNFQALFCRCRGSYDPAKEREAMIQCLACEDWFHESCCNLRERPGSAGSTPIPQERVSIQNEAAESREALDDDDDDDNDASSEASSSGLPPPLVSALDYESFVCGACVLRNATLKRWAGTYGVIMVVRDGPTDSWRRFEGERKGLEAEEEDVLTAAAADHDDDDDEATTPIKAGTKRPSTATDAADSPDAKRPKNSPDPMFCLAPPRASVAGKVLGELAATGKSDLGTGDIFLTEGFRERWCRCVTCWPSLESNSYLLKEEVTYEPPPDPDSVLSLEELGMRALSRLPREKAIEGIHAFNAMKDDLVKFLRPFAQQGKVVNESDVRAFFASLQSETVDSG